MAQNKYEKPNEPSALRKLFGYLCNKKVAIIFSIIASLLCVACNLIAPLLIKKITEMIISWNTYVGDFDKDILLYSGLTLGMYVGVGIFQYISIYIISGIVADGCKTLRATMIHKINRLPMNYFDTRNIGDVLSYVSSDIDVISTTLTGSLPTAVSSVATIIGVTVILFILSWQIALITIVVVVGGFFSIKKIADKSEKNFEDRQNRNSQVSSQAEEAYTAYNIVRVFNASEDFKNEFSEINFSLEKSSSKADYYSQIMEPSMKFLFNIILCGIALISGYLANKAFESVGIEGAAQSIATIIAAISYANLLMSPLSQISTAMGSLQQTVAAASRVFSFIEEVDEPDESNKHAEVKNIEGNITFENVKFGYNKDRIIIHDFCQKAKKGQKVAIVGPTGAGKTTMVNLLMRFYELNSGHILIDGVDTFTMNRSYCRGLFGMVLQDTWLFEGTIMENLKYSRPEATDEEVIEACKITHCDEFIRQQPGGYNHILNEDCGLSAGQKQLLTIARAMVQNAPMLILDEATSNIDTRTELLIQDAMDNLTKGRTSFVIAHRLSTIKNSDLIIVMKDGDVLESGNHDELMKLNGFYAQLYNSQFTGQGPQFS